MIDICIPVYRNPECLRASARGVRKFAPGSRVLLHVQDPGEEAAALEAFASEGIEVRVVSQGGKAEGFSMATYMNRMFSCADARWVVLMEQDTFLRRPLAEVIEEMEKLGHLAAGPLDTMFYDHPNAFRSPKYGQYARLSPMPGYFHSSLVIVRKDAVPADPFSVPEDFEFHGRGCLGTEPYYGLRMRFDGAAQLTFLRQEHSSFGLAADLVMPSVGLLATHLYYSGTRAGYLESGFLSREEFEWLGVEEERFLNHYQESIVP